MSGKKTKKPATQEEALVAAFVEGALPEEDRRAPELPVEVAPEPEPEVVEEVVAEIVTEVPQPVVTNDLISHVFDRGDGVKVDAAGCIIEPPPPRK